MTDNYLIQENKHLREMLIDGKEKEVKIRDHIHRVFRFVYNFPHDFIDQAWQGWIAGHLNDKWRGLCQEEGYGSPNAFFSFYFSLDNENRIIFTNYINNYICKIYDSRTV